jgi:hypothetical protein
MFPSTYVNIGYLLISTRKKPVNFNERDGYKSIRPQTSSAQVDPALL